MSDDPRRDEGPIKEVREGEELPVEQLHEKVEPHKPEPPQDDPPKAA